MTDEELAESARITAKALDKIMKQIEERGWSVSFEYDTWPILKRPLDLKIVKMVDL